MVGYSYFGNQHSRLKSRLDQLLISSTAAVEVLSDPLISSRGIDREAMQDLGRDRDVFLQGKALSIGSADPLDQNYLALLKILSVEVKAQGVGDFLAWTGVAGRHLHALMPVVYNSAMLKHLTERVRAVQDFLGMPIRLENTLVPVSFKSNEMTESEFLGRLCDSTGCGISLNLPNLLLNAKFRNYDVDNVIAELETSWISSLKIYPMPTGKTFPFALEKEEWDRTVWSLLSGFIKRTLQIENTLPQVFVRDEGQSTSELGLYVKWAGMMLREVEHGLEGTSGVVSPLSL